MDGIPRTSEQEARQENTSIRPRNSSSVVVQNEVAIFAARIQSCNNLDKRIWLLSSVTEWLQDKCTFFILKVGENANEFLCVSRGDHRKQVNEIGESRNDDCVKKVGVPKISLLE